jgi:hypothetical protein
LAQGRGKAAEAAWASSCGSTLQAESLRHGDGPIPGAAEEALESTVIPKSVVNGRPTPDWRRGEAACRRLRIRSELTNRKTLDQNPLRRRTGGKRRSRKAPPRSPCGDAASPPPAGAWCGMPSKTRVAVGRSIRASRPAASGPRSPEFPTFGGLTCSRPPLAYARGSVWPTARRLLVAAGVPRSLAAPALLARIDRR